MRRPKPKKILAVFLTLLVVLTGLYGVVKLRYPNKYLDEISLAASEFGVEAELIQAVIWTESKYNKNAESNVGARGLMQLMQETAEWCCEMLNEKAPLDEELFDPEINIRLGTYYLSFLLKRFDERDAIAAYNAGQGRVRKWLDDGLTEYPFKETQDYVKRVSFARKIYRSIV